MSRSRKHHPAGGHARAASDAAWKAAHARRRRRRIREQVRLVAVLSGDVDPWVPSAAEGYGEKDGRKWYGWNDERLVRK